jgi:hypothetical protein
MNTVILILMITLVLFVGIHLYWDYRIGKTYKNINKKLDESLAQSEEAIRLAKEVLSLTKK